MTNNNPHRIVLSQINLIVGGIDSNTEQIIDSIKKARTECNANTVVFPELAITGYPPEDLLYRPAMRGSIDKSIKQIAGETSDIGVIVGYPRYEGSAIYNSCIYIRGGHILASYDKIELPNYGVFDEKRYFSRGSKPCLIDLNGISVAITICEDIWAPLPVKLAATAGARLIINISASPFHDEKRSDRISTLKSRVKESNLPIVYVNLIGGQDELVFDGGSMVLDSSAETIFRAPEFEQGRYYIDIQCSNDSELVFNVQPSEYKELDYDMRIYKALVTAVRDYANKNGFNGIIIGLSGGIDSALVTCIAVDALGIENVEVILMPSLYTTDMSIEDSKTLAHNLKIKHHVIPIEKPFSAFTDILHPIFGNLSTDTTEENIQARCRGIILMALSNKTGKLVLATGNKSEMSVGYATLYGDMAGGYAPLKDIPKMLVYQLSKWRNSQSKVIPNRIFERPPTAELKSNQRDDDTLPPYDTLDPILERYIERDMSPMEIINAGFDRGIVMKIVRLVDKNEYKRRQAAPGVKIGKRAFGSERRYPITSGYRED